MLSSFRKTFGGAGAQNVADSNDSYIPSDTDRERPLMRNFAEQQAEFFKADAHRLCGNTENLGELSRDHVEDN
jgi:hypothetical protein